MIKSVEESVAMTKILIRTQSQWEPGAKESFWGQQSRKTPKKCQEVLHVPKTDFFFFLVNVIWSNPHPPA